MATARQTGSATQIERRVHRIDTRRRVQEPVDLGELSGDRFFRHLVLNLRTGVVAITLDGRIAAMNDMAYRADNPRTR